MTEEGWSSDCSVMEMQVPPKPSPPCIVLEEEDVILNVSSPQEDEVRLNPFYEAILRVTENVSEHVASSEKEYDCPNHWTLDMIKFYEEDWGDEESFLVHKLQQEMDKNPNLWKVSDKDIVSGFNRKNRKKQWAKCFNCCQFGHVAASCPDPPKVQKCYMCGGAGHEAKRCPNSKCLNCGAPSKNFVDMCNRCIKESEKTCARCKLQGHYFINCSDHWRKFHVTTSSTFAIGSVYHGNGSRLWCSNCGRKGHFELDCRSQRNVRFPQTSPYVSSYDDLFSSARNSDPESGPEEKRARRSKSRRRKKRYFQEIEKNDSTSVTGQDDEITVLFDKSTEPEKKKKRKFSGKKTINNNKGDKLRRTKEVKRNRKLSNIGKWKELFKHQKRKEIFTVY